MEHIDLDLLTQLIALLKANGVTEFAQGDLRLVVRPAPEAASITTAVGQNAQFNKRAGMYASLFNGRIPSFDDFKQAGLVTEEQ